jgi:hypothetical protein
VTPGCSATRPPAALAVFAAGKTNTAWSSYRGGWQQLETETNTTSWPLGCLAMIAIGLGPVAYLGTVIWLGTNGMAGLARDMIYLVVAGAVAAVLVWLARRSVPPPYAELDGQVIRQWMVSGDDDSPDEWHVAVDDGTREKAWDFSVGSEPWRWLTPGTFVHARVNLRDRPDPEERVEVRHAADARPGPPPGAWRAPVVAVATCWARPPG